jgi:hypothetical protein
MPLFHQIATEVGCKIHDEALRGILGASMYSGPPESGRLLEGEMRNTVSKAIVAGVAALSLATAVVATTEPAQAQWRHGGGWGGGGWHGGGWHGGGWGGGGWHGGGGVWHPGYWRNGGWYGGWWGPAVVAGLAAGAITAPYWGGWGGGGCWQVRPVYSMDGVYLGNQQVNVCQ